MPDISSVTEALVAAVLAERRSLISRTARIEWTLLGFAALCAGAGVFFLTLALYQYLGKLFTPPLAAFVSAAAIFAAAALAILARELVRLKKTPARKPAQDEFSENIHALITSLRHELEEPVRENPKMSVAIAALAGLFTARHL